METRYFYEACDASAAVRLGSSTQFAAASDEDNVLRVYDRAAPGAPVSRLDVTPFLGLDDPGEQEADLEGAAQLGDRIYWIGSHGRSRTGRKRPARQRLIATTVHRHNGVAHLEPAGMPYVHLLRDVTEAHALARFGLGRASLLSPEEPGGLNLEGLAAGPEGALLVGFRNPVPEGRALIVRIGNPTQAIDGSGQAARLTVAGHLDLGGRGIRALEYVPALAGYLIVAGAWDDVRDFALYRWSGDPSDAAVQLPVDGLSPLNPEELLVVQTHPDAVLIDLLSDDGGSGTGACKGSPLAQRRFRSTAHLIRL